MPAREAGGIRVEVLGGCLRLESPPGPGTHLHATLLLSVSYWLQRGRTRLLPVTDGALEMPWQGALFSVEVEGLIADSGLTTARVHIHDQVPQEITVWAIAGELRLDLAGAELDTTQEVTIAVNVILGHVHLDIPRNWPIHLPAEPRSDRLVLTRIKDIGVRSQQEGDHGATLHMFGFCGAITLLRQ